MIPAWQASRAGFTGGDESAGVDAGGLQATHQGLQGHGDHDGGGEAAGLGEPVGGVGLEVLAERPAHPLRRRAPLAGVAVDGGAVLGCGDREQGFLEHGAVQGRQGELPWTFPCPSRVIVNRAAAAASRSSFSSLCASAASATSGARVQDALAEDPSSRGARWAASATRTSTAFAASTGRGRRGGPRPHARSPGPGRRSRPRRRGRPGPARTGRLRALGPAASGGRSRAGPGGSGAPTSSPSTRPRQRPRRAGCRRGQRPAASARRAGASARVNAVSVSPASSAPIDHNATSATSSSTAHTLATARDTGWRSGVWSAAMGPIQAVTTDIQTPISGLSTGSGGHGSITYSNRCTKPLMRSLRRQPEPQRAGSERGRDRGRPRRGCRGAGRGHGSGPRTPSTS